MSSSSSTARSSRSRPKRQPAKLANFLAKCSATESNAKPSSKLRMSSSKGRLTRSLHKRQQVKQEQSGSNRDAKKTKTKHDDITFDSFPAVKLTESPPKGKTTRHLSIIASKSNNSSLSSSRSYDKCGRDWNSERQSRPPPTTTGILQNPSTDITDETWDTSTSIINSINSITSHDWDILDDIVQDSFGGMDAIDLSLEITLGANLECQDPPGTSSPERTWISTRTVTPHNGTTPKMRQNAPLLHTPLRNITRLECTQAPATASPAIASPATASPATASPATASPATASPASPTSAAPIETAPGTALSTCLPQNNKFCNPEETCTFVCAAKENGTDATNHPYGHVATRAVCKHDGCTNKTVQAGVCNRHGAKRKTCKHDGCTKRVALGGVCTKHRAKAKTCKHEGCTNKAVQGGVCNRHGAKRKTCNHAGCIKRVTQGEVCTMHGGVLTAKDVISVRSLQKTWC